MHKLGHNQETHTMYIPHPEVPGHLLDQQLMLYMMSRTKKKNILSS